MSEKTAVATQPQTTALDMAIDNKFINQLSEQLTQKQEFGLSFPATYNVANALNSAYLILQETADKNGACVLKSCSKQSIASTLMDMAVQGLNPMKKQCYFIAMGGKLKLMRSYQGTMSVAKRCGIKTINAEVIYEGDVFTYRIENGLKVIEEHTQDFMNIDVSKIKGAYVILTLDDGTGYTEIMNITQIKKAWSKGYGYKDGQGVHGDFGDQMAKKTVIARACKNFINSSDDANLMEAFDNTTYNEDINVVEEDVRYEIEEHANTEEFEMPEQRVDEKPTVKEVIVKSEVVADKKPVDKKPVDVKPSWAEEGK